MEHTGIIEAQEKSQMQLNHCATEGSTSFQKKVTSYPVKGSTLWVFGKNWGQLKKTFAGRKDCRYLHQNVFLSGWKKSL